MKQNACLPGGIPSVPAFWTAGSGCQRAQKTAVCSLGAFALYLTGDREPYISTRRTWSPGFFDIKKSNQRSGSGGIGKFLEQLQPRHSRVCSCLVPFQNSVRVPLPETSLLPFSPVQYYQCCSSATELSPLPRPSAYQLCSSDCLSAAAEFMPIYFICQF